MNRCIICQTLFESKRSHARLCSAKCRKQASRGGFRGVGADYEIVRQSTMTLSQNKKRALILYMIGDLDDGQRGKLYGAIEDDVHRVKSVTSLSHFD